MEANGSKLIELLEVGYSDDVSGEKEKRKPRVSSFVEELPPTDNSIATSIFLVLNTMIGSGILNQPAVFQDAGIVGAVILYIIGAICTYLGILVLVECADFINIYDYERLVHAALGDWGELLLLVAIFWGGFGALIRYTSKNISLLQFQYA